MSSLTDAVMMRAWEFTLLCNQLVSEATLIGELDSDVRVRLVYELEKTQHDLSFHISKLKGIPGITENEGTRLLRQAGWDSEDEVREFIKGVAKGNNGN